MEYMVVFGTLAAALVGLQIYLSRSMQGRIRYQADQISDGAYSPGAVTGETTIVTASNEISSTESVKAGAFGLNSVGKFEAHITLDKRQQEEIASFKLDPLKKEGGA